MPRPDPIPSPPPSLARRFARVMRFAALLAVVLAALAVALVMKGARETPIHFLIATALGVGLSSLLASALAALMVLSHRSGHDSAVADFKEQDKE